MQIITGDETGLLKLIDLEKKEVIKKYGEQSKDNKVIQIATIKLSEISFFLILRETTLLLLDNDLNEIAVTNIESSPLKCFFTSDHKIIVTYKNRKIILLQYDQRKNEFSNQKQINSKDFPVLTNLKEKYVTSSSLSRDEALLLITYFGGAPSVFSLKTKGLFWQSRNVKNDELDLQVKMFDYDGIFLDDYSVGTITMHQSIRVYNILQEKSQPIFEYPLKQSATKIVQIKAHQQKYYMINQRGEILIYSKDFTFERSVKGTFGAVRDLILNNDQIYTVSLDRFLRVYQIENLKCPLSINLSQRLTTVNFCETEHKEIQIEKKEEKIWTIHNGKEAKARFQGMRRNTIKLPYLQQMFLNHKLRKVKLEEQQIKQEEKEQIQQYQQDLPIKDETRHNKFEGIKNKKIEKLAQKKKILDLKKKKLLVNKPKQNLK